MDVSVMPTAQLTLDMPTELAEELAAANQQFLVNIFERGLRDFKIERALVRYAAGGMSFGAAAQKAGISQSDLARHAYGKGMEPPFSDEMLKEELRSSTIM